MASIAHVLSAHFDGGSAAPSALISNLDIGLMQAGQIAQAIYDLAVHPAGKVDEDRIAAISVSLLTFLGQLGASLDSLGEAVSDLEREIRAVSAAPAAGPSFPAGRA